MIFPCVNQPRSEAGSVRSTLFENMSRQYLITVSDYDSPEAEVGQHIMNCLTLDKIVTIFFLKNGCFGEKVGD